MLITYFDMFAGVGGFRAGLERAGGFECVGHCEIDKHADAAYRAVHNIKESEVFYEDAKNIQTDGVPEFDLLCAGFPCQSFSVAGKRRGFLDPRGTMFFEIARVVAARKPAYLLLENVPGLLSHDKGRTFAAILHELCELGYGVQWQVLNSKDFGVPQSRRRVYIIGYLDPRCAGKILPVRDTNAKALIQLIGGRQDSRVYDPAGLAKTLLAHSGGPGGRTGLYAVGYNRKSGVTGAIDTAYTIGASDFRGLNRNQTQNAVVAVGNVNPSGRGQSGCIYDERGLCPTLTTNKGEGLKIRVATKQGYQEADTGDSVNLSFANQNQKRARVGKNIANTLDTSNQQGVVTRGWRIRRLVPRECFRLQGFSEEQIDKFLENASDTQAYKQAGNAVTVNVVHALGLRIKSAHAASVAATCADKERLP